MKSKEKFNFAFKILKQIMFLFIWLPVYTIKSNANIVSVIGTTYIHENKTFICLNKHNLVDIPSNLSYRYIKETFTGWYFDKLRNRCYYIYNLDFHSNTFLSVITNLVSINSFNKKKTSLFSGRNIFLDFLNNIRNTNKHVTITEYLPLIEKKSMDIIKSDRISINAFDFTLLTNFPGIILYYRNEDESYNVIIKFISALIVSLIIYIINVLKTYFNSKRLNKEADKINTMLQELASNGFISVFNVKVSISPKLNPALLLSSQFMLDGCPQEEAALFFMEKEGLFGNRNTNKLYELLQLMDKVGLKDEFINQMTDDIAIGRGVINDIKTLDEMIDMIMNETDISEVSELLNKTKDKKEVTDQTKTTEKAQKETEADESTLANMSKDEIKLELRKLYRNMYRGNINIQNIDDAVLDEMILNNIKKGFINHIDSINEFLNNYDNYIDEVKNSTEGLMEEVFKKHVGVELKEMVEQVDRQIEYIFGNRERVEDRLSEQNAIDTEHFVDNIDELGGMTNENIDKLEVSDVVKDLLKEVSDIKQKNRGRITVKDYLDLALKYKKDIRKFNILIRFTGMYLKSIKDRLTTDINNTLLHVKILNSKENIDKIINERKELVKSISDSLNVINVGIPANIFKDTNDNSLFFMNIFELMGREIEKGSNLIDNILKRYREENNDVLNNYVENLIVELFKDTLIRKQISDFVYSAVQEELKNNESNQKFIDTHNVLISILNNFNLNELNDLGIKERKAIYAWLYKFFVSSFIKEIDDVTGLIKNYYNNHHKKSTEYKKLTEFVNMMKIYKTVIKYIMISKGNIDDGLSDVFKNILKYYFIIHSYMETEIYNDFNFADYMDYKAKNTADIMMDENNSRELLSLLKITDINEYINDTTMSIEESVIWFEFKDIFNEYYMIHHSIKSIRELDRLLLSNKLIRQ